MYEAEQEEREGTTSRRQKAREATSKRGNRETGEVGGKGHTSTGLSSEEVESLMRGNRDFITLYN
jgi:hypothetical protein